MSAPVPSSGSRWSDIENIVVRSPQINGFRCSLVHALCLTSGAEHFQQSNKLFIQQSLMEPLLSNRHRATLLRGPFDDCNGDVLSLRSRRPRAPGHICVTWLDKQNSHRRSLHISSHWGIAASCLAWSYKPNWGTSGMEKAKDRRKKS